MMFCFTDFVNLSYDALIQYKIGKAFITLTLCMIVVNIANMIVGMYLPLRIAYLRRRWINHMIKISHKVVADRKLRKK
jgi:hypothetical protein